MNQDHIVFPCFTQKEFEENPMLQFLLIDYNKRRRKFLDKEALHLRRLIDIISQIPYYQTSDHSETIIYEKLYDMNYAKHVSYEMFYIEVCVF